jgi:hypothetical protein
LTSRGVLAIGRDLDAGISGLQWTVGAYTVVMASLLMFSGSTWQPESQEALSHADAKP